MLYVVDAAWNLEAMQQGRQIPFPLMLLQHDAKAYRETWTKLQALQAEDKFDLVACHCERTQHLVETPGREKDA